MKLKVKRFFGKVIEKQGDDHNTIKIILKDISEQDLIHLRFAKVVKVTAKLPDFQLEENKYPSDHH